MRINEYGQPVGDPVPGWTPRRPLTPSRLEGRHATLVALAGADREALFAAVLDPPEAWTYLAGGPFEEYAAFSAYLDSLAVAAHPMVIHVAGEPVGMASFMAMDPANGSAEVGTVLFGPALRRTPAATEAISLMIGHAFEAGYRRFEWKCDSLNEPSRRAAARLGFTYEGRFRQRIVYKGRSRDTDWFSLTDTEWPAVRAEHERWLDPANFDATGRQLTKLMSN